jgi:hypothetical protein
VPGQTGCFEVPTCDNRVPRRIIIQLIGGGEMGAKQWQNDVRWGKNEGTCKTLLHNTLSAINLAYN